MGSSANSPKPAKRGWFSGMSFRSRLSWSAVLLVAVAVASTALYTFYRTGVTNTYLTNQINTSVLRETEKELSSTATRHARELDNFFASVNNNMETLGITIETFLDEEQDANEGWNASLALFRLSQGSWDNANIEAGSVFVPAQDKLPNTLVTELNSLKRIDFIAPSVLKKNPDMIALYFGSLEGETMYYPNVDLANILPPDFDITQRPWFLAAAPDQNQARQVVWSVPYQDAALNGLVVTSSLPVYDGSDRFRGVIAADLKLVKIAELISSIRVAQTGYAFLLDGEGRVIAMPESGYVDFGLTTQDFEGDEALKTILTKVPLAVFEILVKMTTRLSGMKTVNMNGIEKYVAYQPIPSIGYSLGIVVPVDETQSTLIATRERLANESQKTLTNIVFSMIALLAGSLLVSRWMGNTLAKPLVQLTETASRLAEGDLSAEAQSQSQDEIGVLANAFNIMTSRLRELVTSLEQRVAERTADLEKVTTLSTKRAEELQVVSEVARAVSTEVNLEELLSLVTDVVSKRFGFYHVGVFLLDNVNKNAVLRASNSPGGKRMVAHGHKLPIGRVGIVGHVAAAGEARIALDVGGDATYFNNPDLPETRSEMALPLRVRGRIIGVLDVQSTQSNAFAQSDVETLSILSDQVAIAIENARLFEESRQALEESQSLYGDFISHAWEQKTEKNTIGYQHSSGTGHVLEEPVVWEEVQTALNTGKPAISEGKDAIPAVAVPIRLRDQVIGILDVRSPDPDRVWTEDEVAVIEAIAERLALALENARLFEETSGRASREHAVAEITSKIRETNDPQVMIRTAIQELQRVLNVSRVEIIPQVVSAHLPGRENNNPEAS
jgi:GAF domain-containing protein/HAMP domain-containing protein